MGTSAACANSIERGTSRSQRPLRDRTARWSDMARAALPSHGGPQDFIPEPRPGRAHRPLGLGALVCLACGRRSAAARRLSAVECSGSVPCSPHHSGGCGRCGRCTAAARRYCAGCGSPRGRQWSGQLLRVRRPPDPDPASKAMTSGSPPPTCSMRSAPRAARATRTRARGSSAATDCAPCPACGLLCFSEKGLAAWLDRTHRTSAALFRRWVETQVVRPYRRRRELEAAADGTGIGPT